MVPVNGQLIFNFCLYKHIMFTSLLLSGRHCFDPSNGLDLQKLFLNIGQFSFEQMALDGI